MSFKELKNDDKEQLNIQPWLNHSMWVIRAKGQRQINVAKINITIISDSAK